jgi:hypothetical protein
LCVIHEEGLCPSSGDINRLMMKPIREPFIKAVKQFSVRYGDNKNKCRYVDA